MDVRLPPQDLARKAGRKVAGASPAAREGGRSWAKAQNIRPPSLAAETAERRT